MYRTWLIQGRFQPENAEESAFVKDNDLFGLKVEAISSPPRNVEAVMVPVSVPIKIEFWGQNMVKVGNTEFLILPLPTDSLSPSSEAAAAIAEVKVAVEATE